MGIGNATLLSYVTHQVTSCGPESLYSLGGIRIVEALRTYCENNFKAQEPDDDDDDAEILCDCKFTLAYGSKILLHNTNLKLKRGKMCDSTAACLRAHCGLLKSVYNWCLP